VATPITVSLECVMIEGAEGDREWEEMFSRAFSVPVSRVQKRIWAEVLGDEYPAELDTYSFVTRTELERLFVELNVPSQGSLADLGCGRGGPGLWLAARYGCRLIGIDIAQSAVRASRRNASELGLGDVAVFQIGTFEKTGLPTDSVDAVVCIDSLLFAPDKHEAIREMARVLKSAGRLGLTTWDYHRQPLGRPPQVSDHRPLLHQAGFRVRTFDETRDWRGRQTRIDELLLQAVDELATESGENPTEIRASIEQMHAALECMSRRVMVVAELP
jgi:ubiquinone/menaquinone biosynthesis C-methylase UbiE